MSEVQVILVDEDDNPLGLAEKMEAHRSGLLHRAFSIFIFNTKGEMLIHRRALDKYHSAGLWTNACCSHPLPEENLQAAAARRLNEEMGMSCNLEWKFSFVYFANLEHGLIEHELDHVFMGVTDELPIPNPDEVCEWRWTSMSMLEREIKSSPERFTAWFKLALPKVIKMAVNTEVNP
ncbi:MAG: isopentenyl-diphosphate Delta-isomerase [Flavobacteriales bacterium]|jgi:isopentenyl-diphosphate Delta-isomerase